MLEKFRAQLEEDLGKVHQAVETSSVMELRDRVKTAIADAKKNADHHFQQLEIVNKKADQFVDPYIEKVLRSGNTALLVGVALVGCLVLGVLIGMSL